MKSMFKAGSVATALVLVLVACTGAQPTAAPTAAPTDAPTGAPTDAPTATPTEAPMGLVGTLEMWQTYGSGAPGVTRGEPAALEAALDAVRAENPELNLNVTEVAFDQLFNTYQLQAVDGVPDLFIAPNDSAGDLHRAGLALDLMSYFSAEELGRFSDLAIDGSTIDGALVQVPESLKAVAVYYDSAKIATFPATTEELLTAVQNGDFKLGLFQGIYHMFGFWGSFGGQLMDDTGKCTAADTGVGDAFTYYEALKDAGATWYPDYANMAAAFNSGDIDAIVDGPWAGGGYQETHPDNLGVAPLPAGAGGPALPLTGVDGWTINPNSDNVDLAVAFAKRMVEPDILKIFADLAVHIPADTSVTTEDPLAEQFAAAVESGLPRPQVPQLGGFWGNFGDALNAVIDAGTDPQQAVVDACAAMDEANGL